MKIQISEDYAKLLPPLTTDEQEVLSESIATEGVRVPIVVDENGAVLDGHHRVRFAKQHDKPIPHETKTGLSEAEKLAYVIQSNIVRRNLSKSQLKQMRKEQKKLAEALAEEGNTQERIGALLGVTQQAVSSWFGNMSNTRDCDANKPDARTTIPKAERPIIFKRVEEDGETQEQVAADYGVDQSRISQIVATERKQHENEVAIDEAPDAPVWKGIFELPGIYVADSTDLDFINSMPEQSIDMVFTDPPWSEDGLECYEALGRISLRVLKPGGLCMAYAGKMFLPELLGIMGAWLDYVWIYCAFQPDNNWSITRKSVSIYEAWRPIVLYAKPGKREPTPFEPDAIRQTRQKDYHDWQQGTEPPMKYIKAFTDPGDIILDPFVGGGSIPWVAKELKRTWLGFDKDEEAAKRSLRRLTKE